MSGVVLRACEEVLAAAAERNEQLVSAVADGACAVGTRRRTEDLNKTVPHLEL